MPNPWNIVREFESVLAEYAGSRFAVAVDSCTAALFLCCHYLRVDEVTIPCRTYPSVPCAILQAGGRVRFRDVPWQGVYRLEPYPIVDGACRFRRGMYERGTFHCLSFQYRKHLAIGRGGMILHDDPEADAWFRTARYSGRHECPLTEDAITSTGWRFYMLPSEAADGLTRLQMCLGDSQDDLRFSYPDLSRIAAYQSCSAT